MDDLPQVRIADCGCILPASVGPVGISFKQTPTGDARVLIFCCSEHDKTRGEPVVKKRAKRT
jgi:hypothetical protein